jgi:hypothetical protein
VGQLDDNSFIIIVDAGRAPELSHRLAARIQQSTHFFYPAKEHMPADERPQLLFTLGLITSEDGPYADSEALKRRVCSRCSPSQTRPIVAGIAHERAILFLGGTGWQSARRDHETDCRKADLQ